MSELHPSSPLAHRPLRGSELGVSLEERSGLGVCDLRIHPGDVATQERASEILGMPLPTEPRTSMANGAIQVLWMSIDQWWITGPHTAVDDVRARLSEALDDRHAAVTDVSAMRAVIRITGDQSRAVLAKCAPIDVFADDIRPGFVRRITFGEIAAALLMVADDPDCFDLFVFRSYGDYAATWLEEAARKSAEISLFAPGKSAPV